MPCGQVADAAGEGKFEDWVADGWRTESRGGWLVFEIVVSGICIITLRSW